MWVKLSDASGKEWKKLGRFLKAMTRRVFMSDNNSFKPEANIIFLFLFSSSS